MWQANYRVVLFGHACTMQVLPLTGTYWHVSGRLLHSHVWPCTQQETRDSDMNRLACDRLFIM